MPDQYQAHRTDKKEKRSEEEELEENWKRIWRMEVSINCGYD